MARLRFPGRPGHRFDRLGVCYGVDEHKKAEDPTAILVANIHRGLKTFRELFGESDEEQEFAGFTSKDSKEAADKLNAIQKELDLTLSKLSSSSSKGKLLAKPSHLCSALVQSGLAQWPKASISSQVFQAEQLHREKQTEAKIKKLKSPLSSSVSGHENKLKIKFKDRKKKKLELSKKKEKERRRKEKARAKKRAAAEKLKLKKKKQKLKEKLKKKKKKHKNKLENEAREGKHGYVDASPGPSNSQAAGLVQVSPRKKGRPPKNKGLSADSSFQTVPKIKRLGRPPKVISQQSLASSSKAKQILARVKKGLIDKGQKKKSPNAVDNIEKKALIRKQFILPTQSSRSSRKIIPNKRFMDIEESPKGLVQAKKARPLQSSSPSLTEPAKASLQLSPSLQDDTSSDIDLPGIPATGVGFSDAAIVLQGKRDRKPSVKLKQVMEESAQIPAPKKHKDLLRKAKFCLNEAALNRSKAALARSLKRQMKRDKSKPAAVSKSEEVTVAPLAPLDTRSLMPSFGMPPSGLQLSPGPVGSTANYGLKKDQQPVFGASGMPAVPKFALQSTTAQLPTFESTGRQAAAEENQVATKKSDRVCQVCESDSDRLGRVMGCRDLVCRSCGRFFIRRSIQRLQGKARDYCDQPGKCTMDPIARSKSCNLCRYLKLCELFPDPRTMSNVLEEAVIKPADVDVMFDKNQPWSSIVRSAANTPCVDSPFVAKSPSSPRMVENSQSAANVSGPRFDEPLSIQTTSSVTPSLSSPAFSSPTTRQDLTPADTSAGESVAMATVEGGHMPRVKHVCRRASVALGQPHAVFPSRPQLRLSALPNQEKQRLLLHDDMSDSQDSDELSMDEIIRQARDDHLDISPPPAPRSQRVVSQKTHPSPSSAACLDEVSDDEVEEEDEVEDEDDVLFGKRKKSLKKKAVVEGRLYKRRIRCKKCHGCLADDCGECKACLDMPKNGGTGKLKQGCYLRKCLNPVGRSPFKEKSAKKKPPSDHVTPEHNQDNSHSRKLPFTQKRPTRPHSDHCYDENSGPSDAPHKGSSHKSNQPLVSQAGVKRVEGEGKNRLDKSVTHHSTKSKLDLKNARKFSAFSKQSKQHAYKGAMSQPDLPHSRRMPTKNFLSKSALHKYSTKHMMKPGRFALQPLSSKANVSITRGHLLKTNFVEDFDIDYSWEQGVAVVASSPLCMRTVCFLCGSAGQHELFYCNVCCEPFHKFCLEPSERPSGEELENWCCRRCQFCHVCGQRNTLLKCNKCRDTYHPGCLGPNYPTKPSKRKKIWVCTKCVKCRSCGATTPGSTKDAVWMHDFSLCYSCGLLMDKGNFCPVCRKCYADDDWDSKMIQCSSCNSWVHAKCEELTDEMYEIMSYLPEDVSYYCRVCQPIRPAPWLRMIKQELQAGIKLITDTMLAHKASASLLPISIKPIKQIAPDFSHLSPSELPSPVHLNTDTRDDSETDSAFSPADEHPAHHDDPVDSTDSSRLDEVKTSPPCGNSDKLSDKQTENTHNTYKQDVSSIATKESQQQEPVVDSDASRSEGKLRSALSDIITVLTDEKNSSSADTAITSSNGRETTQTKPNSTESVSKAADGRPAHVMFADGLNEDECKTPVDLKAVRDKHRRKQYMTVDEYVSDVVRILTHNMSEDMPAFRKKANNYVRLSFIKNMEKCFPWFNVRKAACWGSRKQLPDGMLPDAVVPPSEDHTYHQWLARNSEPLLSPQPSPFKQTHPLEAVRIGESVGVGRDLQDTRRCAFCAQLGDADPNGAGRLLYASQDDWVHVNCALWSAEVYEEVDGMLQNVHNAMARGRKLRCDACDKVGPTVGCCHPSCHANFHLHCAIQQNCTFQADKQVFCNQHWFSATKECLPRQKLAVKHRSCVEVDKNKWTKKTWQNGLHPSALNILIGSMTVDSLGFISSLSDTAHHLYPVNYSISRVYWSTHDARRRCVYTCRIIEVKPVEPKVPEVFMKNITIVHDKSHPEYSQELEQKYTTMLSPNSQSQHVSHSQTSQSTNASHSPAVISDNDKMDVDGEGSKKTDLKLRMGESTALSRSWPLVNRKRPLPDLSGLSDTTRKLLMGTNLEKYSSMSCLKQVADQNSDLALNIIADRLNKAAAKNQVKKVTRGSSVDHVAEPTENMAGYKADEPTPSDSSTQCGQEQPSPVSSITAEDIREISQSTDGINDEKPVMTRSLRSRGHPPQSAAVLQASKRTPPTKQTLSLSNLNSVAASITGTFSSTVPRSKPVDSTGSNNNSQHGKVEVATVKPQAKVASVLPVSNSHSHGKDSPGVTPAQTPTSVVDSLSDAELSSSDFSDTDIDLRENYEYLDESSNECSQSKLNHRSPEKLPTQIVAPVSDNITAVPGLPECRVALTRVEDIPLHHKIAEKIKAESLARSSPSDQGPFKCYKCKRLYRTRESWQVHSESCDFVVSSDEEDEDEVKSGVKGSDEVVMPVLTTKVYPLRSMGGISAMARNSKKPAPSSGNQGHQRIVNTSVSASDGVMKLEKEVASSNSLSNGPNSVLMNHKPVVTVSPILERFGSMVSSSDTITNSSTRATDSQEGTTSALQHVPPVIRNHSMDSSNQIIEAGRECVMAERVELERVEPERVGPGRVDPVEAIQEEAELVDLTVDSDCEVRQADDAASDDDYTTITIGNVEPPAPVTSDSSRSMICKPDVTPAPVSQSDDKKYRDVTLPDGLTVKVIMTGSKQTDLSDEAIHDLWRTAGIKLKGKAGTTKKVEIKTVGTNLITEPSVTPVLHQPPQHNPSVLPQQQHHNASMLPQQQHHNTSVLPQQQHHNASVLPQQQLAATQMMSAQGVLNLVPLSSPTQLCSGIQDNTGVLASANPLPLQSPPPPVSQITYIMPGQAMASQSTPVLPSIPAPGVLHSPNPVTITDLGSVTGSRVLAESAVAPVLPQHVAPSVAMSNTASKPVITSPVTVHHGDNIATSQSLGMTQSYSSRVTHTGSIHVSPNDFTFTKSGMLATRQLQSLMAKRQGQKNADLIGAVSKSEPQTLLTTVSPYPPALKTVKQASTIPKPSSFYKNTVVIRPRGVPSLAYHESLIDKGRPAAATQPALPTNLPRKRKLNEEKNRKHFIAQKLKKKAKLWSSHDLQQTALPETVSLQIKPHAASAVSLKLGAGATAVSGTMTVSGGAHPKATQHLHPQSKVKQAAAAKHPSSEKKSMTSPLTQLRQKSDSPTLIVHPQHKQPILPAPVTEEEVKDTPLVATRDIDSAHSPRSDVPHLRFRVESDDGFVAESDSPNGAWQAVTEGVQEARSNSRMTQLSYSGLLGEDMFGLTHSTIVYLIEQLHNAAKCSKYHFKFHHYPEPDDSFEEPIPSLSGAARGDAYSPEQRKQYDMFSFLLSKYRQPPPRQTSSCSLTTHRGHADLVPKSSRRSTSLDLPMAMRFRHLRAHAREAVGVYRSPIHGRGLFCKRTIDASEMVIEYAGEVIRGALTDTREKYYESKGIGCYMFRIDDYNVVDATVKGNAARFINHSCDPNCFSKVIDVNGSKHIVIFALKRIERGEELTYDYKFPLEEVKIPCTCNSRRCRKYLN